MENQVTNKGDTQVVRPKALSRRTKDYLWAYLFIAPTFIGLVLFLIGPIIFSFYISLTRWDNINPPVFIGLGNYIRMMDDAVVLGELWNTLVYTMFIVPITLVVSILIAVLLSMRIPAVGFFRVAIFLPYITLPVASAMVWQNMFNTRFGMINGFLRMMEMPIVDWLGNITLVMGIIVGMTVWAGMGYFSIILVLGIKNIPTSYLEAARIDGASRLQTFLKVTLPLLTPQIFFVVTICTINAFQMFDAIFVFGESVITRDGIRTLSFGIFERGFTFQQMGYATANATVLLAMIMLVTVLNFVAQRFWVHYDN